MKRTRILHLLQSDKPLDNVIIMGWVRTRRDSRGFSFLEINDGSCLKNMQVIADSSIADYEEIKKITTGSAVAITGSLMESPGKGQKWELKADNVEILGIAPDTFPLQKKRHSDEFLRTIAHLRSRTNKYGAVFRIRSELSFAIHQFFKDRGFKYIHTPVLTASDCEGAGEMFKVTALDMDNIPKKDGKTDFSLDFFGAATNLTVSGQLSAEMFALALGDVYTFGPTFRAENSNTSRHVAEFWMVEPEMAFSNLTDAMDLSEEFLKYLTGYIIDACLDDLELFAKYVDKNLMTTLEGLLSSDFTRLSYKDAVDILNKSKQKFEFEVDFGKDLQSEHERYLTERHFKQPVIIYDYPKNIKPFYMRINDDNKTVAAMDVLVPNIGEIIGGSQREERLNILEARMDEMGLSKKDYWWYIESRKYGSAFHSGFGMGFERLLMFLTGVTNIRDVIPFPRTPNSISF
ncbi:MAG: asparaginyl-tRNA synthetase [Desulfobacteraceae bacterium Eth-SRB1]|nr:MAG: asparaginyl-tRNA synthetase [Desulfobacteraceae bacterium Eth-SRB1]